MIGLSYTVIYTIFSKPYGLEEVNAKENKQFSIVQGLLLFSTDISAKLKKGCNQLIVNECLLNKMIVKFAEFNSAWTFSFLKSKIIRMA